MESSFTGGWYPDLDKYKPVRHDMDMKMDFIVDDLSGAPLQYLELGEIKCAHSKQNNQCIKERCPFFAK